MTTPKSTLKSPMDNTQRLWDIFNSILNQLLRVLRPSVEKRCSENCSFSSVSKNFQCPRQSCCLRSRTLRKYKTNNMCLRTDVLIHDHVTSKPFLLQKMAASTATAQIAMSRLTCQRMRAFHNRLYCWDNHRRDYKAKFCNAINSTKRLGKVVIWSDAESVEQCWTAGSLAPLAQDE